MFVWIPRYAYKITKGYHTNEAGTIEVAFIDTNNRFLNGENGTIITDPSKVTYTDGVQNEWLVHPAFTASAENGGGFGEIAGIWVGKFEATGTKENVTVKPGERALIEMTINEQYKAGLNATLEERMNLKSHMAKNSEWGAIAYLGHSKYGANGQKIEQNANTLCYTGGTENLKEIYKTNKEQSTTQNAYGVYDMSGGAWERTASYLTYKQASNDLENNGGTNKGDLYGTESERNQSTMYKTVYQAKDADESSSYELTQSKKGDAIYETSNGYETLNSSWYSSYSTFPHTGGPFFIRGDQYGDKNYSTFCFSGTNGTTVYGGGFRIILVI